MGIKFLQNKSLLGSLILMLLFSLSASAQMTTLLNNGATSGNVAPGTVQYHASEHIYTDAELGTNFTTSGTAINRLALGVSTLGTTTTFGSVNIYLKDVPSSTTLLATGMYSLTGYTLVYSGSYTLAATGFTNLTLTTPYTRAVGTNLQMLITRTDNAAHTGYIFFSSQGNSAAGTAALTCRRYNSATVAPVAGTSSLVASNFRQAVRFQHVFANDAAIQQIYTLGRMPVPYATPHTITTNISNGGTSAMTNVPVTLTVSGANSFTDVQTIASLAVGANTNVSFTAFSPVNIGQNTVSVALGTDDYVTNNTSSIVQDLNANSYTYAYGTMVGGTYTTVSSGGVGFTGATGDFVAKFFSNTPAAISQMKVNFSAGGQTLGVAIWDATGAGGTPGTLLWDSPTFTSNAGVNTVAVSPAVLVSGDFFVGVRQSGTVNASFAYQAESPIRTSTFYYRSPINTGTWTDFAPNSPFKFMIEPKLSLQNDVGVASIAAPVSASVTEMCGSITPSANISNFGAKSQAAVPITYTIKQAGATVYTNTQTISLSAGVTQTVTFGTFTPTIVGAYTAECTTALAGDGDTGNDMVTINFSMVQNNHGTTATYKYANAYACQATAPITGTAYAWNNPGSTEITWTTGDDDVAPLTIPFPFSFYGTNYTTVYASTNGWISFTDPSIAPVTAAVQRTSVTIPTAGGLENYIAGAMRDMDMTAATYPDCHLYYTGDATQFIITYWHVHIFSATSATDYITFQIILKPDGSIKLQYNDSESTLVAGVPTPPTTITNASTIGIENTTGSEGLKYRFAGVGGPMFGSPMAVDIQLLVPLPLQLMSFSAENKGKNNQLTWRTASEVNTSHFVVQRSKDGAQFADMGQVQSINDRTKVSTYSFTDQTPLNGNNYYRLKMMDRDGQFKYSNVEVVNSSSLVNNVKVYPNPTQSAINTDFNIAEDNEGDIEIYDAFGKQISKQHADFKKGKNHVGSDLSCHPTGVYMVKILIDGNAVAIQKVVKQ
jgi:hypothetical protein